MGQSGICIVNPKSFIAVNWQVHSRDGVYFAWVQLCFPFLESFPFVWICVCDWSSGALIVLYSTEKTSSKSVGVRRRCWSAAVSRVGQQATYANEIDMDEEEPERGIYHHQKILPWYRSKLMSLVYWIFYSHPMVLVSQIWPVWEGEVTLSRTACQLQIYWSWSSCHWSPERFIFGFKKHLVVLEICGMQGFVYLIYTE